MKPTHSTIDKPAKTAAPSDKGKKPAAAASQAQDKASAASASQTAQSWPFPAGSQGDNRPLPSKPAQRAGWNARQFRI